MKIKPILLISALVCCIGCLHQRNTVFTKNNDWIVSSVPYKKALMTVLGEIDKEYPNEKRVFISTTPTYRLIDIPGLLDLIDRNEVKSWTIGPYFRECEHKKVVKKECSDGLVFGSVKFHHFRVTPINLPETWGPLVPGATNLKALDALWLTRSKLYRTNSENIVLFAVTKTTLYFDDAGNPLGFDPPIEGGFPQVFWLYMSGRKNTKNHQKLVVLLNIRTDR